MLCEGFRLQTVEAQASMFNVVALQVLEHRLPGDYQDEAAWLPPRRPPSFESRLGANHA